MSNRLTITRNQGWFRLGLVGVAVMLPVTMIQHALGFFSEGWRGFEQAAEYFACGAAIAMILGAAIPWALRGFVARARDDGEEEQARRPSGAGAGSGGRQGPRPKA